MSKMPVLAFFKKKQAESSKTQIPIHLQLALITRHSSDSSMPGGWWYSIAFSHRHLP